MKIKDQNMFLISCIVGTIIFLLVVFKPFKFENETKVVKEEQPYLYYTNGGRLDAGTVSLLNTAVQTKFKNPPELQKELDDLKKRIDAIEQKAFEKESK